MRKVMLLAGITLDGCIARPDGSVDYLSMTKEGSAEITRFFSTIDTIIMGRKTLDVVIALCGGSYKSPVEAPLTFSRANNRAGERDGVIFTNQSPVAWLRKIRACRGKHIFHMGGGELARSFLQADFIDELYPGRGSHPARGAAFPSFPAASPSATSLWWRIRLTRRARSH